jgi:hypothetical protein
MQQVSKKKNQKKVAINAIISSDVKDYGNDPYFIKKANESKDFLEKHGFPEELMKNR